MTPALRRRLVKAAQRTPAGAKKNRPRIGDTYMWQGQPWFCRVTRSDKVNVLLTGVHDDKQNLCLRAYFHNRNFVKMGPVRKPTDNGH